MPSASVPFVLTLLFLTSLEFELEIRIPYIDCVPFACIVLLIIELFELESEIDIPLLSLVPFIFIVLLVMALFELVLSNIIP